MTEAGPVDRNRKLLFAVMLAVMGFAGMMAGKMMGDAFAFHCVGIMGFLSGSLVAEKVMMKREVRLSDATAKNSQEQI